MKRAMTMAIMPILLVAAMLAVPAFAEADALSPSDIHVTVQGSDVDPTVSAAEVSMTNNATKTVTIFVVNRSSDRLSIFIPASATDDSDVKASAASSSSRVLEPTGSTDNKDLMTLDAVLTSDNYADSGTRDLVLTLNVQNLDGSDYITVPIHLSVNVTSEFDSGDKYNKFFGIIPNTLPSPFDSPLVTILVTLIGYLVVTWVACKILAPILIRLLRLDRTSPDVIRLEKRIIGLILIIMLVVCINECIFIFGVNASTTYFLEAFSKIVYVVGAAVIAWLVYSYVVMRAVAKIEEKADVGDSSLVPLFKMIGKLIIAVGAVAAILASFGVDLAGILVSAGVVSLGITLGAQNVLNQFFSGIVLLATRPFKKGDFVKIGGEVYIVRKVRLMYSEFSNWAKDQKVTIPNNVVSSATLVNLSQGDKKTWIHVFVSVAYGSDMTKVKELLIQAANMHPHVIKNDASMRPSTKMTNWGDSGVEYRLACYVDNFDDTSTVAGQLQEIIYSLFMENGIEIPYSRVQIDVLSVPEKLTGNNGDE
ncbi:MAG: mechanosensitive ion channel [Candidatus Methanomethylophilaceae archaeon]|nr:mechanosensitive ion channel [Candidatus Methanomethylophilaceae archaeon]